MIVSVVKSAPPLAWAGRLTYAAWTRKGTPAPTPHYAVGAAPFVALGFRKLLHVKHAEARFDAATDVALDPATLAAIKPNDVVHLRARVVEIFDDCITVDVIGPRSRFRVHPCKVLLTAVEPSTDGEIDVVERLCGEHGRIHEVGLPHLRRDVTNIAKK